jgi:hypothetical protein
MNPFLSILRQKNYAVLKWSALMLTVLFLPACGTPDAKFLAEVEKLENTLAKAEASLKVVDTSRISNYLHASNENLRIISESFRDTMNKDTAILIADYAASRKSLRMFLENYSDVLKELDYSGSQLQAMRSDIENNLMPEDKFTDYIFTEAKSVERLEELVENLLQWYGSALRMYEEKNPYIEKIIRDMEPMNHRKRIPDFLLQAPVLNFPFFIS